MSTATVSKLPSRSNFDKKPRFVVNGLRAAVIIEAMSKGESWDEAGARETADLIAQAFNSPAVYGRGHDET